MSSRQSTAKVSSAGGARSSTVRFEDPIRRFKQPYSGPGRFTTNKLTPPERPRREMNSAATTSSPAPRHGSSNSKKLEQAMELQAEEFLPVNPLVHIHHIHHHHYHHGPNSGGPSPSYTDATIQPVLTQCRGNRGQAEQLDHRRNSGSPPRPPWSSTLRPVLRPTAMSTSTGPSVQLHVDFAAVSALAARRKRRRARADDESEAKVDSAVGVVERPADEPGVDARAVEQSAWSSSSTDTLPLRLRRWGRGRGRSRRATATDAALEAEGGIGGDGNRREKKRERRRDLAARLLRRFMGVFRGASVG
ncbi:hypothetical protein GGR54DRAFT_541689 [Hypoxylon sp. NC1633]|nr:hypothetical protein GGR54DRAFT_541689 [Hypoxylon sp. NC1633]